MSPGRESNSLSRQFIRCGVQCQQRDLGRAIQAYGNTDGSQAGSGVEGERTYVVCTAEIFLPHLGQEKRRQHGILICPP